MTIRITAGALKGRRLVVPETARPSSVRLRTALFDLIQHAVFAEDWRRTLPDAGMRIGDFFAGSGAVGLEALSRFPQAQALFVEQSADALACLRANLRRCRVEHRSRLLRLDVYNLPNAPIRPPFACHCLFLDPPYHQRGPASLFSALIEHGWLMDPALVVLQTETNRTAVLQNTPVLKQQDSRRIGTARLHFFLYRAGDRAGGSDRDTPESPALSSGDSKEISPLARADKACG